MKEGRKPCATMYFENVLKGVSSPPCFRIRLNARHHKGPINVAFGYRDS